MHGILAPYWRRRAVSWRRARPLHLLGSKQCLHHAPMGFRVDGSQVLLCKHLLLLLQR